MFNTINRYTLFYNYPLLIFIYAIANGLLFMPGSLFSYLIPPLFLIYATWINFKYNKFYVYTRLLYVFMIYFFILVFFSSNFLYSLKNVLKTFTPLLYFGVAVAFVNNYKDLNRLFRVMIILGFFFILNIIVSNILDLGGGSYSADETGYLQTGSIYSEGLNTMGYFLVLVPAIIQIYPFKSLFRKLVVIFSAIVIFVMLLLIMKRGALLVVLIGFLVMLYFSEFKQKRKLFKVALFLMVVLAVTYPFYKDILLSRYKEREDRLQLSSYETEGRYTENSIVINDIFFSGNPIWLLFGHEVLNSSGNYGRGIFGARQLHNDYAQVLNGSGIVGLILYLLMNVSILLFYLKLKKRILLLGMYKKREKLLNNIFWAFFIAYFALGVSGSIDSLVYNVIRFIFLGAIIGVFKNVPYYNWLALKERDRKNMLVKPELSNIRNGVLV